MIPLKLQLRNFMCYRGGDNTINFDGIHLAALTGDNGQGKSALLDAMTWALWGKGRAKRDDDLITHGETEMDVRLDFMLGGDQFQVARRRSSTGRGSSLLDLYARRSDGTLASLSEPSIRETQARITQLLRLDYDTFINASFLVQGRADEFTTRRPGERKQILADILGLAEYDRLATRAKEVAKGLEEARRRIADELEEINQQADLIPSLEEALIEAEGVVKEAGNRLRESGERHQALIDQRRALEAKGEQRTQAEQRIQEGKREVVRVAALLQEQRAKLTRFDTLLTRSDEIGAVQQELADARESKAHWDELQKESLRVQGEQSELLRQIDNARAAVEAERRDADARARAATSTITRLQKKTHDLDEAQRQIALLAQTRAGREEEQRLLNAEKEQQGRLKAENEQLKHQMDVLKERIALLEGTEEASCPVCRRPLSDEARTQALDEANAEGTGMGDRWRANVAAVRGLNEAVNEREAKIEAAGRQLAELDRWQRRASDAASAAEEVSNAQAVLAVAEQERSLLDARLEANDYAHDAQRALAELAGASAAIGYDKTAHEAARAAIQRLQPREREVQELQQAQAQRPLVADLIVAQEENHRRASEAVALAEAEVAQLTLDLQARDGVLRDIEEASRALTQSQSEQARAQRDLGAHRQRLEFAEQHAARRPEVQGRYDQTVQDKQVYDQLGHAFSKQGIQTMLIEAALPEIEHEANALLDRMTDGRMSVRLLTQRESRTTDSPIETLDIVIADESGARAYETFSGGEAFRINFALRIALSKLLATRAGANLRTLIMDEGFGSQDAKGRERLIEAITSVQEDFDRILVITHIDELKDAFPVRLDVVKGERGSKVFVR